MINLFRNKRKSADNLKQHLLKNLKKIDSTLKELDCVVTKETGELSVKFSNFTYDYTDMLVEETHRSLGMIFNKSPHTTISSSTVSHKNAETDPVIQYFARNHPQFANTATNPLNIVTITYTIENPRLFDKLLNSFRAEENLSSSNAGNNFTARE